MAETMDAWPNSQDDLVVVGTLPYGGRDYTVTTGRNSELVNHIVVAAHEPQMLDMVPKDAAKRFKDRKSFETWYAKGRFLTTIWFEGEVAQIIPHGKSSLTQRKTDLESLAKQYHDLIPELSLEDAAIDFPTSPAALHTMAVRTYPRYQGMPKPPGQEVGFSRLGLQLGQGLYLEHLIEQGRLTDLAGSPSDIREQTVWCETNKFDKTGKPNKAVSMYTNAGYEPIGTYVNPDPTNVEWRVVLEAPLLTVQSLGTLALLKRQ